MSDGNKFKAFRKNKGWTLKKLESESGVSNPYLSQMETGKIKSTSILILRKLARAYGMKLSTLCEVVLGD